MELNRDSLEFYVAVAIPYRQNLELLDSGRMCSLLERASDAAPNKPDETLEPLDRASDSDAVASFGRILFSRIVEATAATLPGTGG